jgi:hypothetical protein
MCLQSLDLGKFDSHPTNRKMYALSVNENLCRWRCLVPDACSEWHQFLAFRGPLPAKAGGPPRFSIASRQTLRDSGTTTSRQTLRDFRNRNISSDPSRLWKPLTSRQALRDSGNHYISSDPARLWEPQHLVRAFKTLRTVHRTDRRGVLRNVIEHRKGSGRWDRSLPHARSC